MIPKGHVPFPRWIARQFLIIKQSVATEVGSLLAAPISLGSSLFGEHFYSLLHAVCEERDYEVRRLHQSLPGSRSGLRPDDRPKEASRRSASDTSNGFAGLLAAILILHAIKIGSSPALLARRGKQEPALASGSGQNGRIPLCAYRVADRPRA
jgi:hypothetical protein